MPLISIICLIIPGLVLGEDKLVVKNGSGTTTFKVEDNGAVTSASILLTNGASSAGSAPLVLGQDLGNRGLVITDKAASNPKNIYIGWNVGASFDYMEIFALQEGVSWKNLVLVPHGGYVGVGTSSPSHPLEMASGAYVSSGGVWTNACSRENKKDIQELTGAEAMDALKQLNPVKFAYKVDSQERHVGFIAEDAPDLVATKDRKGLSPMDLVAVLTKVVKEQQKAVEKQQKIAREQQETIAVLSRRLAELESRAE